MILIQTKKVFILYVGINRISYEQVIKDKASLNNTNKRKVFLNAIP